MAAAVGGAAYGAARLSGAASPGRVFAAAMPFAAVCLLSLQAFNAYLHPMKLPQRLFSAAGATPTRWQAPGCGYSVEFPQPPKLEVKVSGATAAQAGWGNPMRYIRASCSPGAVVRTLDEARARAALFFGSNAIMTPSCEERPEGFVCSGMAKANTALASMVDVRLYFSPLGELTLFAAAPSLPFAESGPFLSSVRRETGPQTPATPTAATPAQAAQAAQSSPMPLVPAGSGRPLAEDVAILASLPPARESALRSTSADKPTLVTFVNRTARDVRLYWLDYDGHRKPYGTIAAGARQDQQTYQGHPWVVTDDQDQALEIFVAGAAPAVATIDESDIVKLTLVR